MVSAYYAYNFCYITDDFDAISVIFDFTAPKLLIPSIPIDLINWGQTLSIQYAVFHLQNKSCCSIQI